MSDWTPTGRLRFVRREIPYFEADGSISVAGHRSILQQEWRRDFYKDRGPLWFSRGRSGVQTEWRDVPVEAE